MNDLEAKVDLVARACGLVSDGAEDEARELIRAQYALDPRRRPACSYTGPRVQEQLAERRRRPPPPLEQIAHVFARDGYIDRYTGQRVVDPGVLRYLGHEVVGPLRDVLPYHVNGGRGRPARSGGRHTCHQAGFELYASYEHVRPWAVGGEDVDENLATAAFDTNGEKGTETWLLVSPPGELGRWDGLVGWFLDQPVTALPWALVAWHRTLARVHA